ncbi:uncharacterized protein BO97DRAFT_412256 [Aspergillus homomorphus CBS 101889]|uniref:TPR-like protein n=1 Tax=Aspergillus homomorphus (strain CBS 101889) TaxID=1450537 RepID=A0A395I4G4_ASPHC|nr:hypothetical protein BO97DRAFT_412256 [Aspergillus homomorphus CBS 101889]RAL14980.1 hypothetical protein BO97DRAFT_412256 [Aspergillus homomorphus CBS 101889]
MNALPDLKIKVFHQFADEEKPDTPYRIEGGEGDSDSELSSKSSSAPASESGDAAAAAAAAEDEAGYAHSAIAEDTPWRDFVDDYWEVDAAQYDRLSTPSPTTAQAEEGEEAFARRIEDRRQLAETLQRAENRSPIDPLLNEFDASIDRYELAVALLQAADYIDEGQDYAAEHYVEEAMVPARRLEDETALARCLYWQGRVEYLRENYADAHRIFQKCRAGLAETPEGETIIHYLRLSRPDLTAEDRHRISLRGLEGGDDGMYTPLSSDPASPVFMKSHGLPTNAKRTWEDSARRETQEDMAQEANDEQREIIHPRSRWRFAAEEFDPDGLQLHRSQKVFTFEMYPQGMAPRARPTKIFQEHPNEVLMPEDDWKEIDEFMQDKRVTMNFLENEGRNYQEAIKRKSQADSKRQAPCTVM